MWNDHNYITIFVKILSNNLNFTIYSIKNSIMKISIINIKFLVFLLKFKFNYNRY